MSSRQIKAGDLTAGDVLLKHTSVVVVRVVPADPIQRRSWWGARRTVPQVKVIGLAPAWRDPETTFTFPADELVNAKPYADVTGDDDA